MLLYVHWLLSGYNGCVGTIITLAVRRLGAVHRPTSVTFRLRLYNIGAVGTECRHYNAQNEGSLEATVNPEHMHYKRATGTLGVLE